MWARSVAGQSLWTRMYNSFGYLTKAGYNGHVFPIVFGETGTFLTAVRTPLNPVPGGGLGVGLRLNFQL